MEVEADAKVVKIFAELKCVFAALESVGVAEVEKFGFGDVVTGV